MAPKSGQRLLVIAIIVALSISAWAVLLSQPMGMPGPLEPAFFLALWMVMMAAMMLPSAAPMILTYAAISKQRQQSRLSSPIFVLGYLLIWSAFGMVAYLAALFYQIAEAAQYATILASAALVIAGMYQLTGLKYRCLSACRTPLGFILHNWREGRSGALRIGVKHGFFCAGCCWALMAVLAVVGIMNLAWMALLTLLIFVEKLHRKGILLGKASGILLIAGGLLLAVNTI